MDWQSKNGKWAFHISGFKANWFTVAAVAWIVGCVVVMVLT